MWAFLETVMSWDIEWGTIATADAGIIMFILERWKTGKYRQCADDAMAVSRVTYSAIEEAQNKDVKKLVAEALNEMGRAQPGLLEINDVMTAVVDPKKADSAPPIKKFFRRFFRGENLAGAAARMALKDAIREYLKKEE